MREERQVTKIVAASLLGDGSVLLPNGCKNHIFTITLTEKNKEHLEHLDTYLNQITSTSWHRIEGKELEIVGKKTYSKPKWNLKTKSHPFFNSFRERMYPNGHKVIDPHYLTLLDWEFLAIWYMQDGYLSPYTSRNSSKTKEYQCWKLGLCTNGFSYPENMFLRSKLKEYLDLDFNVNKDITSNGNLTYRLVLSAKDIDKMIEGVKPYIQSCFNYKISLERTNP